MQHSRFINHDGKVMIIAVRCSNLVQSGSKEILDSSIDGDSPNTVGEAARPDGVQ